MTTGETKMTYEQLLEHLENMNTEQLKMNVVFHINDEWVIPSMLTLVEVDHDEEGFVKGQPILI